MSTKFIQLPTCKLAEFVSSGATSFDVSGFLYNDGVTPVDPADIGDVCFATLEPKTPREELISFTIDSVTSGGVATITAVRGLSQKSPYGAGGAAFDHQNGSDLVISNNPGLFNKLAAKANDEVITGEWEFPEPTGVSNPATKGYADTQDAVVAGLVSTEAGTRAAADTALDNAMVKKTTDQTIAGVKTFSSSPVVPTATTSGQAVNKGQVEAYIAANSGDIKASDTAFGTVKLDVPADDIAEPKALSATDKRRNFINAIVGMIFPYVSTTVPSGFLLCDGSAVSRTTYADLFAVAGTTYGIGNGSTTFNLPDLRSRFPLGYSASAPTKVFTFASRSSNVITVTGADNHANNELQTGQAVLYSAPSGAITGLVHNTTYYVVRVSATTFSLATSVANANAGTVISLSSNGTGTQTFTATYTARPLAQMGGEQTHALNDAEAPSHSHKVYAATGAGSSYDGVGANPGTTQAGLFGDTDVKGGDTPHNIMPLFTVVNYIIKT